MLNPVRHMPSSLSVSWKKLTAHRAINTVALRNELIDTVPGDSGPEGRYILCRGREALSLPTSWLVDFTIPRIFVLVLSPQDGTRTRTR